MEKQGGDLRLSSGSHAAGEGMHAVDAAAEACAKRGDFLVSRPRLMRQLAIAGTQAGLTFICAPRNFGKTAILLERAMAVQSEEGRGIARIVDARSCAPEELVGRLESCESELDRGLRPLVAIDNMPELPDEDAVRMASLLRRMRDEGFEIVVACAPSEQGLMRRMGDAVRLSAQALKVQTKEYAAWADELSISPALDIYGLTQGIPSLVATLRNASDHPEDRSALASESLLLYREVFREPAGSPARRTMMAMLLLGEGSIALLVEAGASTAVEVLSRIAREYPMFGLDGSRRAFRCLDMPADARLRIRRDVAEQDHGLVGACAEALVGDGRVGEAVELCDALMTRGEEAELVSRHPIDFPLAGHARFVEDVAGDVLAGTQGFSGADIGLALSCYVSGLVLGDRRTVREAASELAVRADSVPVEIDEGAWRCACACEEVWGCVLDARLPSVRFEGDGAAVGATRWERDLLLSVRVREAIGCLEAGDLAAELRDRLAPARGAVDLPRLVLELEACLMPFLAGVDPIVQIDDDKLLDIADALDARRLAELATTVRMVAAAQELLRDGRTDDAQAFGDAGLVAVRRSDMPMQLFCTLLEGWQNLSSGQVVNARFRGQQALKLIGGRKGLLHEWAQLLERCAYVRNTSIATLREDAEQLDLEAPDASFAEAWATALHLSSIRSDAELAFWYSSHKDVMLDRRFRSIARLALSCFTGERMALVRLIPERVRGEYVSLAHGVAPQMARASAEERRLGLGQVSVSLFGGFRVEKNGYTLTERGWRRKQASVLAARLALCLGNYVSRLTITEEFWPHLDYQHARERLYVTLSALRKALGQRDGGPQYLLTQGDSIAFNRDFVTCDVARFDALARDVLLRRQGLTAPDIIESCLAIEQLYRGPLYVPEKGTSAFFSKARSAYLAKFVDCMIAGCTLAIEEGQLPKASWIVQAALRHAPTREDVVRCAMRVLDLQGRRREIVELYNSHLHYLAQEVGLYPEKETRELYEKIVGGSLSREMI